MGVSWERPCSILMLGVLRRIRYWRNDRSRRVACRITFWVLHANAWAVADLPLSRPSATIALVGSGVV